MGPRPASILKKRDPHCLIPLNLCLYPYYSFCLPNCIFYATKGAVYESHNSQLGGTMWRRRQGDDKFRFDIYVLGMLYFKDDTKETTILGLKEQNMIYTSFANIVNLELSDTSRIGTYYKFKLSERDNTESFNKILPAEYQNVIREIQFGYYHHRAIFKITFHQDADFTQIRRRRKELHGFVRSKFLDPVINNELLLDQGLKYIYSYSLILIENGYSAYAQEKADLAGQGYDKMFNVRSTTFGLYLPAKSRLFRPEKEHYLRISAPSIMVYMNGTDFKKELFENIIDAIYYGGLCHKIRQDVENGNTHSNDWSNSQIINVLDLLNKGVKSTELSIINQRFTKYRVALAILALSIAAVAEVPRPDLAILSKNKVIAVFKANYVGMYVN